MNAFIQRSNLKTLFETRFRNKILENVEEEEGQGSYRLPAISAIEADLVKSHTIYKSFDEYKSVVPRHSNKKGILILVVEFICNIRWILLSIVADKDVRRALGESIVFNYKF